jgi:hypothetical protein
MSQRYRVTWGQLIKTWFGQHPVDGPLETILPDLTLVLRGDRG